MSEFDSGADIAIIGMAGRFPGADDIGQFWKNLCEQADVRQTFTDEQLSALNLDSHKTSAQDYVRTGYCLHNVDEFAASFFDMTPRQARMLDPQQRIFLEAVWHALEHAGYVPDQCPGQVGVYAGANFNNYIFNVADNTDLRDTDAYLEAMIANDKDYLTSRVAHKFNFNGPAVTVQTSCSSSLAAIATACQSLIDYQCDMAVSGGAGLNIPQQRGYRYFSEGGLSKDGACHAFDTDSTGVVHGNGVGVVILKRLEDAQEDRDNILAVIKGWAINNDGNRKVAYEAPSVDGQVEVVQEALSLADVAPQDIRFIETHGTGTPVGDPIEFRAIQRAYNLPESTNGSSCALGSVKTNVGHLGAAAGVAGVIKAALSLHHRQLPGMMHFTQPNPELNMQQGGFYVNPELETLAPTEPGKPLAAGVSSFGIGGTNVHLIMSEYLSTDCDAQNEQIAATDKDALPKPVLLPISARTETALKAQKKALHDFLVERQWSEPDQAQNAGQKNELNLTDLANTLQQGRKAFSQREFILANDIPGAIEALSNDKPTRGQYHDGSQSLKQVAFMYPGSGEQYAAMAETLYQQEPVFQQAIDECADIAQPLLDLDLRDCLCQPHVLEEAEQAITRPDVMLVSVFVVEYALSRLWQSWGVTPDYMIGHSLGEYSAALEAGVFTLQQGIELVIFRGKLIEKSAPGSMLIVNQPREQLLPLLADGLSLAAHNGENLCMVSGPVSEVSVFAEQLKQDNISYQVLPGQRAAHSSTLEPVLDEFRHYLQQHTFAAPQRPFISNVTGDWITPQQATSPEYWVSHLRHTVEFHRGIELLLNQPQCALLEIGPGRGMATMARRHPECDRKRVILSSLPNRDKRHKDSDLIYKSLGGLWIHGVKPSWKAVTESSFGSVSGYALPIPGYPFERQSFWFKRKFNQDAVNSEQTPKKRENLNQWFYHSGWKQQPNSPLHTGDEQADICVVFGAQNEFSAIVQSEMRRHFERVICVSAGKHFTVLEDDDYVIRPDEGDDYIQLFELIGSQSNVNILHLWNSVDIPTEVGNQARDYQQNLAFSHGYLSLMNLMRAMAHHSLTDGQVKLSVVSKDVYRVTGDESLNPELAAICGPCKVIPYEFPHCQVLHLDLGASETSVPSDALLSDLLQNNQRGMAFLPVAYRHGMRWQPDFPELGEEGELPELGAGTQLKSQGAYLITGGFGGVGATAARWIASNTSQPTLYLLGRTPLPDEKLWEQSQDLDESVRQRIELISELKAMGANVIAVSANCADEDDMATLAHVVASGPGHLNGIVHAAGVVGGGLIQLEESASFRENLNAKIKGSQLLMSHFAHEGLDFVYLCSSLGSLAGSFGQVENTAANSYLDAFAHSVNQSATTQIISVNWDFWLGVGMINQLADRHHQITGETITLGIDQREGMACFDRLALVKGAQVVVSCADLNHMMTLRQQNIRQALSLFEQTDMSAESEDDRPELDNPYIAPESKVEQVLVQLWAKRLGIARIGVEDNFIELGGDSMLALPLMADMREALQCELPLKALFSEQNIRAIANYVIANEASSGISEQIADIFLQVMGMDSQQLNTLINSESSQESQS